MSSADDSGPVVFGGVDLRSHPVEIAPALLGARLTSRIGDATVIAQIVEVEAYGGVGEDPGSHAYRRQTPRNSTMFGPPGLAYVYFTYGMHWCLNLVTGPEGTAGAVLIRAARVIDGVDVAWARRSSARREEELCRGPARLTAALGVTGADNGSPLVHQSEMRIATAEPDRLALVPSADPVHEVIRSARTGVRGAGAAYPWRFAIADDRAVSPYRPAPDRPSRSGPHRASGQIAP